MSVTEGNKSTDLTNLLKISNQVSSNIHFKLIQFPFNLIENQAAVSSNPFDKSLIDIAKENNIKMLSNRPLNANTDKGALRLVVHNFQKMEFDLIKDKSICDECFNIIEKKIQEADTDSDITNFPIISYLKEKWMEIPHEEAFRSIFHGSFFPFVKASFDNNVPPSAMDLFERFKDVSMKYYLKTSSNRATDYLEKNGYDRLLPTHSRSLPYNLCREYLNMGIDHVLVGMRKPRYINELKELFNDKI